MSYKINYTPEDIKRYPISAKRQSIKWGKYSVLILGLLAAFWMKMNGVPDFLIPGDPEITRTAVETMVSDMQAGEPVDEAVFAFCKTVIDGAEE